MRAEFSKQTKRDALKRSGGLCEAVGTLYGLPEGQRCNAPLAYGVEFDHVILEANSHDNSLKNCAACCKRCNQWKAHKHDTPLAAKTVRQRDKNSIGRQSRRPMDGSRASRWKKTFNHGTVPR